MSGFHQFKVSHCLRCSVPMPFSKNKINVEGRTPTSLYTIVLIMRGFFLAQLTLDNFLHSLSKNVVEWPYLSILEPGSYCS